MRRTFIAAMFFPLMLTCSLFSAGQPKRAKTIRAGRIELLTAHRILGEGLTSSCAVRTAQMIAAATRIAVFSFPQAISHDTRIRK